MAFASPLSKWTGMTTKQAMDGDVAGLEVRASWSRADKPADVMALAFPTRGRSVIILLIMAHADGGAFPLLADLLATKTTITAPPVETDAIGASPSHYMDPRGFSLELPPGWRRVRPAEVEALAPDGSGSGEEGADPQSTVGFVRPALARQSANMILDVSDTATVATESGRKEMEERYRMLVGQRGSDFTLDRVSLVRVASIPSLLALGRMEASGGTVLQSPYFVRDGARPLILTGRLPGLLADGLEPEVESVLGSISLGDGVQVEAQPPGPGGEDGRDPVPWAAGGAAVLALAVVLILARWRRGRSTGAG